MSDIKYKTPNGQIVNGSELQLKYGDKFNSLIQDKTFQEINEPTYKTPNGKFEVESVLRTKYGNEFDNLIKNNTFSLDYTPKKKEQKLPNFSQDLGDFTKPSQVGVGKPLPSTSSSQSNVKSEKPINPTIKGTPVEKINLYNSTISNIRKRNSENLLTFEELKKQGDVQGMNQLADILNKDQAKITLLEKGINAQKEQAKIDQPNTLGNNFLLGAEMLGGMVARGVNVLDESVNIIKNDMWASVGLAPSKEFEESFAKFQAENKDKFSRPSDYIAAAGTKIINDVNEKTQTKNIGLENGGSAWEALKNGNTKQAAEYGFKGFINSLPTSLAYINPYTALAVSGGMVGEQLDEAYATKGKADLNDLSAGAIKASLEVVTERMFGAGKVTRDLVSKFGKDAAEQMVKETATEALKKTLISKIGKNTVEEIGGEVFNKFGSNVVDKYVLDKKEVGLFDGVGDAAIIALFAGGGQGGVSTTLNHYIDKKQATIYQENKAKADNLMEQALNTESEVVANALEKRAEELNTEAEKVAVEQNKIGEFAEKETVAQINSTNQEIDELQQAKVELEQIGDVEAITAIDSQLLEKEKVLEQTIKQAKKEAEINFAENNNEKAVSEVENVSLTNEGNKVETVENIEESTTETPKESETVVTPSSSIGSEVSALGSVEKRSESKTGVFVNKTAHESVGVGMKYFGKSLGQFLPEFITRKKGTEKNAEAKDEYTELTQEQANKIYDNLLNAADKGKISAESFVTRIKAVKSYLEIIDTPKAKELLSKLNDVLPNLEANIEKLQKDTKALLDEKAKGGKVDVDNVWQQRKQFEKLDLSGLKTDDLFEQENNEHKTIESKLPPSNSGTQVEPINKESEGQDKEKSKAGSVNEFQYVIDKANKGGVSAKGSGTKKVNLSDKEAAILNKTIEKLEAKAVENNGASFNEKEPINVNYEKINGKEQKINTYNVDGYEIKYKYNSGESFTEIKTPQGDFIIVQKQFGKTEVAYLGNQKETPKAGSVVGGDWIPPSQPDNVNTFPLLKGTDVVRYIPESVAQKAWEVWDKEYQTGQSLQRTKERGGFGINEMDMFYPNWREESNKINAEPIKEAPKVEIKKVEAEPKENKLIPKELDDILNLLESEKIAEEPIKEQPIENKEQAENPIVVEITPTKEEDLPIKEQVNGFTEAKDLNRIYADLKKKYGEKKGSTLYEVADRLVNPNKNTIVEIRANGVVVKENDKYILLPFGNTDANSKKWTLYKGIDVTNQFAEQTPTEQVQEVVAAEVKEVVKKVKESKKKDTSPTKQLKDKNVAKSEQTLTKEAGVKLKEWKENSIKTIENAIAILVENEGDTFKEAYKGDPNMFQYIDFEGGVDLLESKGFETNEGGRLIIKSPNGQLALSLSTLQNTLKNIKQVDTNITKEISNANTRIKGGSVAFELGLYEPNTKEDALDEFNSAKETLENAKKGGNKNLIELAKKAVEFYDDQYNNFEANQAYKESEKARLAEQKTREEKAQKIADNTVVNKLFNDNYGKLRAAYNIYDLEVFYDFLESKNLLEEKDWNKIEPILIAEQIKQSGKTFAEHTRRTIGLLESSLKTLVDTYGNKKGDGFVQGKTVAAKRAFDSLKSRVYELKAEIDLLNSKERAIKSALKEAKTESLSKEIIDKLQDLKLTYNNRLLGVIPPFNLIPLVWNGSITVLQTSIKAGKAVKDAIQDAIDYVKSKNPTDFNEEDFRKYFNDKLVVQEIEQEPIDETEIEAKAKESVKETDKKEEEGKKREKSVLKQFMNSTVGLKFKEDIESLGLEYVVKDLAVANEYAKYLYENLSLADALREATYEDVKTLVYGAAIDDLSKQIDNASGEELAELEAERKKVVNEFDEHARNLGRGISAIGYWYLNNASAIEFMLKREIENANKKILSPEGLKEKETIQYKLDQVSKELADLKEAANKAAAKRASRAAESKADIEIEKEITKKGGIKNASEAKKKQIDDFFDKIDANFKANNKTFGSIIPVSPEVMLQLSKGVRALVKSGVDLQVAITETLNDMLENQVIKIGQIGQARRDFNKAISGVKEPRAKTALELEREAANEKLNATKQKYRELEKELKAAGKKEASAQKAEADAIQKVLDNVERENFRRIVNEQKELKEKREKLESEKIKEKQDLDARLLKLEERKAKAEADAIQKMADNIERENFKRAQNQAKEAVRLANEVRDKKKQIAQEVLRGEMTSTEYKQFIEELLLSSDEIQAKSKQDFIDKLTAKLKEYNIKDASKYVEAFVAERDAIINEKAQQILNRTFKGIQDKINGTLFPNRKKIETQRIMEAIMYGALNNEDYAKLFYEKFGIVDTNNPEVKEKLKALTEMYKNAPSPFYKEMILARAAGYIGYIKAKNKNLNFWLNYFYNNILFHYDTISKMIKFNVTAKVANTALLMAKNPMNAMYFAKKMWTKNGLTFSKSLTMAEAAIRDKVNMKFDLKENDAILNIQDLDGGKLKRIAYSFNRMASRLLGGGDAFFSSPAAEAKLTDLLLNEFDKELRAKGIKLNNKELQALINDIVGHDEGVIDAATEEATKDALEYYKKNTYEELTANEKNNVKLNILYILNKRIAKKGADKAKELGLENINVQSINIDKERADKWAKASVLFGRPEGTLGLVSDMIGTVGEGAPWTKPIFATIINAPFNMANLLINGSPIGIIRLGINLSRSKRGLFLSDNFLEKRGLMIANTITADQKKEMAIRVATAQLFQIGLLALSGAWDDDDKTKEWIDGTWRDKKFYLTADLTGDYRKNESLKKTAGGAGLEEYSVYVFGHKIWDYKDDFSGLFFMQAGIYMDAVRSGRIDKDKKWYDKLIAAQLLELQALKDISSLSSIVKTVDLIAGEGKYKGEELNFSQRMQDHWETSLAKTITAGGLPAGRMYQSLMEDYRALTDQVRKEPYGVADKLKMMVGLEEDLRTKTDFFGQPIKERFKVASPLGTNFVRQTPTNEWLLGWEKAKESMPMFTLIQKHNLDEVKHKLRMNQAMTDLGKYGIGKIDLTQRQIDEINEARGKALYKFLSDPINFKAMDMLDDKDFSKVVTLVMNTANRAAFQKVVEGKTTNLLPTKYIQDQEALDLIEIDEKIKDAREEVIRQEKIDEVNKTSEEMKAFRSSLPKEEQLRKEVLALKLKPLTETERTAQMKEWGKAGIIDPFDFTYNGEIKQLANQK